MIKKFLYKFNKVLIWEREMNLTGLNWGGVCIEGSVLIFLTKSKIVFFFGSFMFYFALKYLKKPT